MALPPSTSPIHARKPDETTPFSTPPQQHAGTGTHSPRMTTRVGGIPETERPTQARVLESSSNGAATVAALSCKDADQPARTAHVRYAETDVDVGSEAEALEIMSLERVLSLLFLGNLPKRFSVPDPANGCLIKFRQVLVSLENATPAQCARLLFHSLSDYDRSSEATQLFCVQHLLNLGVDVNLTEHEEGKWRPPLTVAASNDSVALVSLLLKTGADPDKTTAIHHAVRNGNFDIVRELLKAGANPWLALGSAVEFPENWKQRDIADFYRQTGMDINGEASGNGYFPDKFSALEMAYDDGKVGILEHLLDTGAHVPDVIRLRRCRTEQQHRRWYGSAAADVIAHYRARRAFLPCSFVPYALLDGTLQPAPLAAVDLHAGSMTAATAAPALESGGAQAQAALGPTCNALVDGLYSPAAVARLVGCISDMPPVFAQAVVQALSLARVLGQYGAGTGARAGELDQGVRVALAGAGLWEKYLDDKVRFEALQCQIDRYQADGCTLLTMAASRGKIRLVRILARLGARLDYSDRHGDYPLTAAAKARKPDTCSALLSLGANAGTGDLQKRSTLFHVAEWLTQTDIGDMATVGRIAGLVEQLLWLGYDFRQPTPEDHAGHAACPAVADLLCLPENCVKLALLGRERTEKLVQAILANIGQASGRRTASS